MAFHRVPRILLILELCMSGQAFNIFRRSSRAQTINAFIGRLIWSFDDDDDVVFVDPDSLFPLVLLKSDRLFAGGVGWWWWWWFRSFRFVDEWRARHTQTKNEIFVHCITIEWFDLTDMHSISFSIFSINKSTELFTFSLSFFIEHFNPILMLISQWTG